MMHKTKIINLYGGPGVGKSTIAAGLFYALKCKQYSCEIVTEYAKDLVYDEDFNKLKNDQFSVDAEQNRRLLRLIGKVDYIITDSPLIMGSAYTDDEKLKEYIIDVHKRYDNIEIFLERNEEFNFQNSGRRHDFDESLEKDNEILDIMNKELNGFYVIKVNENTISKIEEIL